MSRPVAHVFSLLLLALVCSPAFSSRPTDSFPLSDYPMFSQERASPELTLEHALVVLPDGRRRPLSPRLSADTGEVLQSMMTIHRELHAGAVRRQAFCRRIAERVAVDAELVGATAVELVSSRFDTVAYLVHGSTTPLDRVVLERCGVGAHAP